MAAEQQDHVVVGKRRQGLLDRIGVRRLGIVDVANAVDLAAGLHTVLERLERGQAATHAVDIGTDGQGSRGSAQGIDDIVMSGDFELGRGDERGLDALQTHDHLAIAYKCGVLPIRLVKSDLADATARNIDILIELMDTGVLDVDNHKVIVNHVLEQLDLGERIVLMALVPAQMVGGNVEQHCHAGVKLGRRCNLIARKLRYKPLVMRAAIDLVHRRLTDVAHSNARLARCLKQVVGQRRGGRLAVGARNGDPVVGRQAVGKLGLTHDLGSVIAASLKECRELRDARACHAYVVGSLYLLGAIDKRRAHSLERTRGVIGLGGTAAIDGDGTHALGVCKRPASNIKTGLTLAQNEQAKGICKRHEKHYPNWKNKARPRAPNAAATIQKRMTTLVSAQPFFSK